ncbi:MAG: hypothetical protein AAB847_00860 [Patescibacteria group bacterium]
MGVDFSGVAIPTGFNPVKHWLAGIAKGLDYGHLQKAICLWESQRKRPAPYFHQNLTTIQQGYEQRLPQKSYFIVVGNHVNAVDGDSQLAGKSNQDIYNEHLPAQNAMECLVLNMFVGWTASQKGGVQLLDQKGWTRTSSRWGVGFAVYVNRDGVGQLRVDWGDPVFAFPDSRARAADSV